MYRLLAFLLSLSLLFSCRSLDDLRRGLAGKDLIQLELFGEHQVDLAQLERVELSGFAISDFQNDLVRKHIRSYLLYGRPTIENLLKRSANYLYIIKKIFREQGIPLDLAYLPLIESGFNPKAVSPAFAVGLWQFMYGTGKMYGLKADYWADERMDVFRATKAAAYHLKYLYKAFGSWPMVLAAYNAGAGKIERGIKRYKTKDFWKLSTVGYLKSETINYVPKFIAITTIVKNAAQYGFPVYQDKVWEELVPYEVPDATDINLLASSAEMTASDFRRFNAAVRRFATPPERSFIVYIPRSRYDRFVRTMDEIPPEERVTFRRYFVKIGDNLTRISERFSIPINPIVAINKFSSLDDIRAGEYIVVPIKGKDRIVSTKSSNIGSKSVAKENLADSDETKEDAEQKDAEQKLLAKKESASLEKPAVAEKIALTDQVVLKAQLIDKKQESSKNQVNRKTTKNAEKSEINSQEEGENLSKIHEFFYLVKPEDTLYGIALRYGLSLEAIMKWNRLSHPKYLRKGRFLYLQKIITKNENKTNN